MGLPSKKSVFLVTFFLLLARVACPQDITYPEEEYRRIREEAISGNYDSARADAANLVEQYPGFGDARILLARIMAWQEEYENARLTLDTLLIKEPGNHDALSLLDDIERWSSGKNTPESNIFAGYAFDAFKDPYSRSWNVLSIGLDHQTTHGKMSFTVNAANLNISDESSGSATELQFLGEAYPLISDNHYAYLSYAFSPGIYLPKHRAAGEIWQSLADGWGLSAGLNYFYFDRSIFIAGISGEKYAGKYWFSSKLFFHFKADRISTSVYVNSRRYFNDVDFLQVNLGFGTAPDEPFDIKSDLDRLSATSMRIAYLKKVTENFTIRAGAGYSREEYAGTLWRNRFEGNIAIIHPIITRK